MAGQYYDDVIGTPFSGVEPSNGKIVVASCPRTGKTQSTDGVENEGIEDLYNKLKDRLDDTDYYV